MVGRSLHGHMTTYFQHLRLLKPIYQLRFHFSKIHPVGRFTSCLRGFPFSVRCWHSLAIRYTVGIGRPRFCEAGEIYVADRNERPYWGATKDLLNVSQSAMSLCQKGCLEG